MAGLVYVEQLDTPPKRGRDWSHATFINSGPSCYLWTGETIHFKPGASNLVL